MRNFARSKSSDPQDDQSSGSNRAALAASLKLPTKGTRLSHQDHAQLLSPSRGHSGGRDNSQVAQHQQQQPHQRRQDQGHGKLRKVDAYDTDAESLDTTVHNHSVIQVVDSQHTQQRGQEFGGEVDEYDHDNISDFEEGGSDEQGGGEGEGEHEMEGSEEQEEVFGNFSAPELRNLEATGHMNSPREVQIAWLARTQPMKSIFDGNQSYPSTTSGPPSNFLQDYRDQDPFPDHLDQQIDSSSPQRLTVKGQSHRQVAEQPFQRLPVASETKNAMYNHFPLIHQAAAIRSDQRTNINTAERAGVTQPLHHASMSNNRPHVYNQVTTSASLHPPVSGITRQSVPTHPNHVPLRSIRQPSDPSRSQPVKSAQHSVPAQRATQAQPVEEAFAHRQSTEHGHVHQQHMVEAPANRQPVEKLPVLHGITKQGHTNGEEPVEDYELPVLYNMSYEQLKNENFDTVPRATNSMLSQDLLQRPLVERLEHVGLSLNPHDQSKFFSSLPAVEWEEAGDWFLDQFSSIITRTKDARRSKRKIAAEFEAEVEQRHEHISRRQHRVEDAMGKMREQAQSLIPKSPRGSKSPSKQSKTSMRET